MQIVCQKCLGEPREGSPCSARKVGILSEVREEQVGDTSKEKLGMYTAPIVKSLIGVDMTLLIWVVERMEPRMSGRIGSTSSRAVRKTIQLLVVPEAFLSEDNEEQRALAISVLLGFCS